MAIKVEAVRPKHKVNRKVKHKVKRKVKRKAGGVVQNLVPRRRGGGGEESLKQGSERALLTRVVARTEARRADEDEHPVFWGM
jgi:hypothetical protein